MSYTSQNFYTIFCGVSGLYFCCRPFFERHLSKLGEREATPKPYIHPLILNSIPKSPCEPYTLKYFLFAFFRMFTIFIENGKMRRCDEM